MTPQVPSGLVASELSAAEVARAVAGELVRGEPDLSFSRVCTDSRQICPGCLFVAICGERFDGHAFVADAATKGATGAIIQSGARRRRGVKVGRRIALIEAADTVRALGELARHVRRRHRVPLVAVTGSNGKTTTKELIYSILTASGKQVLRSEGNYNNLIGVPLTLFALERAHEAAVVEMGMNRGGEIARLTEICEPDVAVITQVAAAHTEGLIDVAGVARAKGELFAQLAPSAWAAVNLDDEWIRRLPTPARRLTFSAQEEAADVRATLVADRGLDGIEFDLTAGDRRARVRLRLLGRHNLGNALAAAAATHALGVPLEAIAAGLEGYRTFARRLQPALAPGGYWVVNDAYNANPASMEAGLRAAAQVAENAGGALFAALGEMLELGGLNDEAHRGAGRLCARLGVRALAYLSAGSGPLYAEGAREAGLPSSALLAGASCAEVARRLREVLRPNDVVLIKGSRRTGMERVADALLEPEAAEAATRRRAVPEP